MNLKSKEYLLLKMTVFANPTDRYFEIMAKFKAKCSEYGIGA